MATCVRAAWLVLGSLTVQLENAAGGWFCESLDLGYPTVRAVVNNRPDRDGIADRTTLMGERAVSASIKVEQGAGARIDQVASSFGPFMVPSARPVLHYVLDRPGTPERTITVRAAGYAWPVAGPIERAVHLQWVAYDPACYDVATQYAVAFSGAPGGAGRGYNRTFNQTYPQAGGTQQNATLQTPGDFTAHPLLRIYGPVTAPVVSFSGGNGAAPFLAGYVVSGGHYIEVNTQRRTAYLDGNSANNLLPQMDWVALANAGGWPRIPPGGPITMSLSGQSTSYLTQCQATWQDGWLT
jgi:hypothetical protein